MVDRLQAGDRFGGYLIEDEVGHGGQAVVYRAHQVGTDRDVALKVFAEVEDAGRLERFRREAIAAARFHHPHIVTIFDAGDVDGVPFISMRLMEGSSLAAVLASGDGLDPKRAMSVLGDVADAVDAIHRRGLIHRDIKPANVLLDDEGNAHLSDFGIAQLDELPGLTTRGDFLGTVEYISPEQAAGNPATPASDIYSFGVLAYEVLAGRPPFMHRQPNAVLVAHVNEIPQAAHELNPSIPETVSPILAQALAKAPADRPRTAKEIVEALRAPMAGVVAARSGTTKVQADGAATKVIAGGPASPTAVVDSSAKETIQRSDRPRPRTRLILVCAGVVAVVAIAAGVIFAVANSGSNPNAAFQKAIAPQMANLNQATLTTANALSTANSASDLSTLGQIVTSQLAAVTTAEAAITGLSIPSGAQPAKTALLDAVAAQRSYLTDLAQAANSRSTAGLKGLQAKANAVNSAYAQFFKLEPGVTNVISSSGFASLSGLNTALAQKVTEAKAAAAKAAAAQQAAAQAGSNHGLFLESCGISYGADGSAGPAICPDGHPNALVAALYNTSTSRLFSLSPNASPTEVEDAAAYDWAHGMGTFPITQTACEIAQAEKGWSFGINACDPSSWPIPNNPLG